MTHLEIKIMNRTIELGIIPKCSSAAEFEEYMKNLSPEHRREIKRKFRKLWRKEMKKSPNTQSNLFPAAEKKAGKPSAITKKVRRIVVHNAILAEVTDKKSRKVK